MSWLIDLKLITYRVMCKGGICEDAICICIDEYLIIKKMIKRIDILYESKIGYSS